VVIIGEHHGEPAVVLLRRSTASPFMPSTWVFPGGRVDAADGGLEDDASWEHAARRECREEAALELAGPLAWFDTWITPSAEPRRFHARFFVATVDAAPQLRADDHETHDGRFLTLSEILAGWQGGAMDLPPPTLATLLRLERLAAQAPHPAELLLRLCAADPRPAILPKLVPHERRELLVMPHDPSYAAIPGEGLPAPERSSAHPLRFLRGEGRWLPLPG
jgi:8-oxo-dGTP pyrophosphatase MutT (NUDIX family)